MASSQQDHSNPNDKSENNNPQNDPKLLNSESSSSESDYFQLEVQTETPITPLKLPSKPPLSPQISIETPKYDQNRIPPEIFNRPTNGPFDQWSVTSNGSLFSLKIGSNDGYTFNSPGSSMRGSVLDMEMGGPSGNSNRNAGKSVASTDGSVSSYQSFAFPILTDGKNGPSKNEVDEQKKSESETQSSKSETSKESSSDGDHTENKNNNNPGWLSCFSWLPSCNWGVEKPNDQQK